MAFLSDTDYQAQIKDTILLQVIDSNNSIRLDAEQKAEAQIRSRLAVRYDVNNIFNKTGTARNMEIVMYYIDMTLYHLHSRLSPGQVPQIRHDRYTDALDWLSKVASGDYAADLPLVGDADGDGVDDKNVIQAGSRTPRNPYF